MTYESKRGEYITSHMLADFRKSPAIYKGKYIDKIVPDVDTPAFIFGRAFHCLILEGKAEFNTRFDPNCPINDKTGKPYGATTKKYEEWAGEVRAEGATPLTPDMVEMAHKMQVAIAMHDRACELLGGKREVEAVREGELCGRKIMGRLDLIAEDRIVDLKTCGDLDWFEQDIGRYGYANQMTFYQNLSGSVKDVWLIAAEKAFPWRAGTWKFTQAVLNEAHEQNVAAMKRLIACEKGNYWPTGFEEARTVFGA